MTILFSFLGGVIPAIIWLWFWLKEDKLHPEPKKYIIITFLMGMVTAILIIPIEKIIIDNTIRYSLISLLFLSIIEEISKYIFAYFTALKRKFTDEPMDLIIYMITIALGFAALENILYLWNIFQGGFIARGILMSNMRFIGSTVLHTASSGIIGMSIALSFYKKGFLKKIYLVIGIILSVVLHTAFNFFIINNSGENVLNIFVAVWTSIIILLLFFEKIKKLKPKN